MVTITDVQREFLIRKQQIKDSVRSGQMAYHAPEVERQAGILWASLTPEIRKAAATKDPELAKRMDKRSQGL